MDNLESILARAEEKVGGGGGLEGTGFWSAVEKVKRSPELADRYGARIASIDERAFRNWAMMIVPIVPGTVLAIAITILGFALIARAYWLEGLVAVLVFYVGFGFVLVATHGLAHLVVGRMMGIEFTSWFVGTVRRPQPGVKIDYQSYLKAPARNRAWMHASGAVVTKLLPFALVGAAVAAGLPMWARWTLVGIGVVQILTDIIWSTRASDWKKYRREMSHV